jgi:signal transduction histidine kinase
MLLARPLLLTLVWVALAVAQSPNQDYLQGRQAETAGEMAAAATSYESVVTRNSILKEYALWRLARIARSTGDLVLERERLQRLVTSAPNSLLYETAALRLSESFFESFAHPDTDCLTPTDLKGLIESTVMVATNEWKYVADVDLDLDHDLPPVPCIGSELNQVVLNLIVNASHAIADVVGSSGNKGKISISAASDETHAVIRIADTGTGIPEHARAKVFEPFFTTKEIGRGTGQGLAMAYNCVVKRHRGTIRFETKLGVGTTFEIRLPLSADTQYGGLPS